MCRTISGILISIRGLIGTMFCLFVKPVCRIWYSSACVQNMVQYAIFYVAWLLYICVALNVSSHITLKLSLKLCDTRGLCLDCMLPGIQVTAGQHSIIVQMFLQTVTPCFTGLQPPCRALVGQCKGIGNVTVQLIFLWV